jgi:hypothetical protein
LALPEELSVFGAMCGVAEQFGKPFDGTGMTDGYCHNQLAEVSKCRPTKFAFYSVE